MNVGVVFSDSLDFEEFGNEISNSHMIKHIEFVQSYLEHQ